MNFFPSILDSDRIESFGLDVHLAVLILGSIYFCTVNPLVEEWFWRVFLSREFAFTIRSTEPLIEYNRPPSPVPGQQYGAPSYGEVKNGSTDQAYGSILKYPEEYATQPAVVSALNGNNQIDSSDLEKIEESNDVVQPAILIDTSNMTTNEDGLLERDSWENSLALPNHNEEGRFYWDSNETERILTSMMYASYHFIVVANFVAYRWMAVCAFVGLTFIGRLWILFRDHNKLGLVSCLLMHSGLDFVVIIVLWDLRYRFISSE